MEQDHESQTIAANEDDALVELVELLETIDEGRVSAKLNEVSMIDNQGRRIYY